MEYKPLKGLTSTLQTLLKVNIFVSAIIILSHSLDHLYWANLPLGVSLKALLLSSGIFGKIAAFVQLVLALVLGIVFLRWIYRANKKLRAFSGEEMDYTPGWSVAHFFIPVWNFIMPYAVMKEIWNVSHKHESTSYATLRWWWFLWILHAVALNITDEIRVNRIVDPIYSLANNIVPDGILILLSITAISLVTQIGAAYSKNIVETAGIPEGEPIVVQRAANNNSI